MLTAVVMHATDRGAQVEQLARSNKPLHPGYRRASPAVNEMPALKDEEFLADSEYQVIIEFRLRSRGCRGLTCELKHSPNVVPIQLARTNITLKVRVECRLHQAPSRLLCLHQC